MGPVGHGQIQGHLQGHDHQGVDREQEPEEAAAEAEIAHHPEGQGPFDLEEHHQRGDEGQQQPGQAAILPGAAAPGVILGQGGIGVSLQQ